VIIAGGTFNDDGVNYFKYNPVIRKSGIIFLRLQNSSDFVENNNILYSGIHDRIFEFDKFNLNNMPKSSRDVFRVSKLFLTSKNEILVGNQFGLWRYKDGHIAAYDSSSSFLKSRITDIAEYRQKYLCLGTRGNGLLLMLNNSIYQISDTSGLISNNIRRIFIEDNHIWLATNQGISIVTINSEKHFLYSIRNISVQDGLLSNEVNDIASFGNNMIVATNSGISFLDKNVLFKKETHKLPFYITDVKLNGILIDSRQLKSISYRKRNLSVSCEALNFSNPGKNNYRYRLLGFDTSWLYTNDLKVQFNPLPYGNYQLQIQAKREYDSWNQTDNEILLAIQCNPPFWTTGWFSAAIIGVISILFFLFYKQRIRLVKKRQEEKEDLQRRIAETEQMALKSQMNPHFIFNSLNSIQQYVIEGDVEGANSFISGFSKLIRQTLEFSSKEQITLDEEISYLKNYLQLEKNKMEDIFQYEVTIRTMQSLTDISIPPLLLQPYVENAVRHGVRSLKKKEGIIQLFFIEKDGVLECRIEDNGIGRERSLQLKSKNPIEYQSKGMSLTANRVALLNKSSNRSIQIIIVDLKNQANDAVGTRVTVLFPV
ncbi:MAG: histidine kinase, partial [Lacibacter sp.]